MSKVVRLNDQVMKDIDKISEFMKSNYNQEKHMDTLKIKDLVGAKTGAIQKMVLLLHCMH